MTSPFDALEAWRRLDLPEARAVAVAVARFAATGEGFVIPADEGGYLVLVGVLAVEMLIDGGTVHVVHVRHA